MSPSEGGRPGTVPARLSAAAPGPGFLRLGRPSETVLLLENARGPAAGQARHRAVGKMAPPQRARLCAQREPGPGRRGAELRALTQNGLTHGAKAPATPGDGCARPARGGPAHPVEAPLAQGAPPRTAQPRSAPPAAPGPRRLRISGSLRLLPRPPARPGGSFLAFPSPGRARSPVRGGRRG